MSKKKILIFSSIGGGGHSSVSKTIKNCLREYDVEIVNLINEVLAPFDPFKKMTAGNFGGEEFYNLCISSGKIKVTNNLCRFGLKIAKIKRKSLSETLLRYLNKKNPDLIISVIPIFNRIILDVASKKEIPFIVITNDLDSQNYINDIENPKYDKFKYVLPFDDEEINKKIRKAKISPTQIEYLGFPLREDFYKSADKVLTRKEFDFPKDRFVVLLMMGAQGSRKLVQFVEELSKSDFPLHLAIAIGKKENLRLQIEKIDFEREVSYSIIGFTEKVADLMAASDLFVTKSGPNSIMEAIYMRLPVLVDNTSTLLFWEELNRDFVVENELGDKIDDVKELRYLVKRLYEDEDRYLKIKSNLEKLEKKNFIKLIKQVVDKVI